MMSGYSATPLAQKLGIKAGARVYLTGAPAHFHGLLAPLPSAVGFAERIDAATDLIHIFSTSAAELAAFLAGLRGAMRPDAVVWVSWPKKSAKVSTDITEDTIRSIAVPLGLVDIKVCAVDAVWSGLKLVVRKELRGRPVP